MTVRVLQVIGAMDRGGAETLIMNLYRAMDRTQVQFDFLVHEERACDYDAEIEELGGRIYRLPRFIGANAMQYKALCKQHFTEHPEHRVVHGHIGSSAALYLSAAKAAGCYTIVHSHAQNFTPGLAGLAFQVASYPTRFIADEFIGCSYEAGRDRFGEKVVASNKFSILNNGINLAAYACNEEEHQNQKQSLGFEGCPLVGHVGRLADEKNHQFLFGVFAEMLPQFPQAKLLLVGRGPLEDELRAAVDEKGLTNHVVFMGVRDDVPRILKAMDLFVFPSIKEGLPCAVVEAQAAGLPCLLSTGVPEHAIAAAKTERLDLAAGAQAWATVCVQRLQEAMQTPRTDATAEVRAHGFDIVEIAAQLQMHYVEVAKG